MSENREVKLSVNNLKISFRTDSGNVQAVRDISFDLYKGETLAIVGESGSGKSVTNRAVMGILAGNAIKEGGEIIYDGQDLMKISEEEFHNIRGDKIAMIFQDPMSSLNPIMRVGKQLTEAMIIKGKLKRKQSRRDFNFTLESLRKCMDAAYGNREEERRINKQLCLDFDTFERKHLEHENTYNRATTAANYALEDLEDVLFRLEKKSYKGMRADIAEVLKLAAITYDKYVVSGNDAGRLNTLLGGIKNDINLSFGEKLGNVARVVFNREPTYKGANFDAAYTKLCEIKEILERSVAKTKPNFFALGYYLTFANKPLPQMPVEELNVFLRQYLDEHFMLNFIERAKRGIAYSRENAMNERYQAIATIKEHRDVFSGEHLDKKKVAGSVAILIRAVERTIDPFDVIKDNLSYTFTSSLKSAVDQYFRGVISNKKEHERYAKEKAKFDALVAKGKNPTYEISEMNLVDLNKLKAAIQKIFDAICASYEKRFAAEFDISSATVDVIDYLKEKASGVAYRVTKSAAKMRAIKLLKEVGIPDPVKRFSQYPFEFSGGMRQRIVIAIALSAAPDILICDEPTTALDVTIQSQILELINKVKAERQLSVIFITHDLGVVANMADRVAVMYAGKIVEIGTADDVFYAPAHPYTWALLSSMPDLDTNDKLESIPGTPPNMIYPPKGDAFAERNKYAMEIDFEMQPPMFKISDTHYAATWLLHPDAPKVEPPKVVTDRINRMKSARRES